jgi:hypothetical protein
MHVCMYVYIYIYIYIQGTYHDYAGDGWTEMKPYSGAPQLYEEPNSHKLFIL